ncbi:Putative berberine/berberine, FAD-binding, type PCMH, subdomain 2 [Septoria linicola]|uniref:Berberine/berberine, FAD-binding, type PCMH, subdomain 2 n=1 Tax=Septoria linicola TaxID=215465 RepID=A0A9Q9AGM9_9PEZI|nr:putative berberine/berberine, FAD-binding, type PCMH, subdomain 2 [Septoria linicola]USW48725.1 Putative berberine/berberine, FAD-binding, type PCMH, subdomain 2 [Septoria linicola]
MSDLPRLKTAGLSGYISLSGPPFSLTNAGFAYNAKNGSIEAAVAPLLSWLDEHNSTVTSSSTLMFKQRWIDVYHMFNLTQAAGGGNSAFSSRLLPVSSVTNNTAALAETLAKVAERDPADQPGVSNPAISGTWTLGPIPDEASSLSSAWRDAIVHLRIAKSWDGDLDAAEAERVTDYMTNNTGYALRQLAPDAGAYFNEADPNEPNWQYSYFGENYAKLRAIKAKYDPEGLQWCDRCVGSEEWIEGEKGQFCKTEWA